MQLWVSVYGAPEVDNGGEFNSQIFRDMAENLNIETSNLSWETAISWAVNAKNSLVNVYGYSPYQIVFGRNPNLPSTLVNKPPALEGETMSKTTGKHLVGLHEARKAFVASESSEKIRRALRKQVRPSGEKFKHGDKVYFLRVNQWKGPGTVVGQDNVVVFIRYGGTYVRVHECRILRDIDEQKDKKNKQQEKRVTLKEGLKTPNLNKNKAEHEVLYYDSDEEEDSHANNQSDNEQGESGDEVEGHESELGSQAGDSELDSDNPVNQGHESYEESRSGGDSELDNDNHEDTPVREQSNEQATSVVHRDDTPREGVVLSRAGKASSSKKNWYNVEYRKPEELKGNKLSIDLSTVDELQVVKSDTDQDTEDDEESEEALFNEIDFCDARKAELENWKKHHVYQEVEDYDASLKWYEKVKKTLNECGGTESKVDPAVFYWYNSNGLAGVLAVHVDDFLWAGTNLTGLSHADDKIILSQTDYVEVLKTVSIDRKRPNDSQLSSVEQTVLRSKVGQLLWLAKTTRPDIAFDIVRIASKLETSTIEDFKRVNKLLRKVRNDPVSLHFKELGEHVELLLYTDASFCNLPDGGSQGGFVIIQLGKNGKIKTVTWQSKKIRRVVRSTLASEA
ncbi:Hypothetical predicted protein [Mytilus galloprovincialis]|uniref:Integrase catalytic domain-containing protein n=1 Tax=Mytilus galloprovincialis TaxID=29158 RepID=A0A8B6BFY4_MYTGA|nr:Hypothetical predicted protein [Mytilus galloprovincialis]